MKLAPATLAILALAGAAYVVLPARAQPHRVQVAGLFGESDEEKAARQQHEDAQDSSIADLRQRVQDLENTLSQLTGQNEMLSHKVQELSDKIDRQKKDFDYKLCQMVSQQMNAGGDNNPDNALPCDTAGSAAPPASAPAPGQGGGAPQQLAPGPGVLGTLPAGQAMPQQSAPAAPDTRSAFDGAMNLLAKAQYDEASAAFRNFADTYPKDDLAPQALYWVGDIAYVQKNYQGAAQAFVEAVKKYPDSPRAADSMLKLGQSLIAMGQKKEGCITLEAIGSKYPKAKTVREQAQAARKTSCR